MKQRILLNTVVAGAVFGLGFWMGRDISQPQWTGSNAADSKQQDVSGSSRPDRRNPTAYGQASALQALIDELKNYSGNHKQSVRISALIGALPLADIAAAFEAADQMHFPLYRHTIRVFLFSRWAELAPRAAALQAKNIPDQTERRDALFGVLEGWGEHDAQAAVDWVKEMSPGPLREECLEFAIKRLAATAPDMALAEVEKVHHGSKRRFLWSQVFSVWAENDPVGAGAKALSLPPGNVRNEALSQLTTKWAERDPAAALAWLKLLTDARERNAFLYPVIGGLLRVDTVAAAKALAGLTDREVPQSTFFEVAGAWAKLDPAAAVTWARQLPSHLKEGALTAAMSGWSEHDPRAAWEAAQQMPEDGARRMAIGQIIETMSRNDPREAAQLALSLPSGEVRAWAAGLVGSALAEGSTQEAKAWLETLDPELKAKVTYNVAYKLAEHDPKAALELASSLPGDQKQQVASTALNVWVGEDPAGAIAWASQLTEPAMRRLAFQSLCDQWSHLDPQAAATYASQFPEGKVRTEAFTQLARVWSAFDPQGALTWAGTLPAGEAHTKAVSTAAWQWAMSAPVDAANYVASLPVGETQDKAALHVLSRWATSAPDAAANWAVLFPESPLRERAFRELIDLWAINNAAAAEQWLTALPMDNAKQTAIDTYASKMSYAGRHDKAAEWAEQLTDEQTRLARMREISRRWVELDPSAAEAWVSRLNLSSEQKRLLLQP